VGSSAGVCGRSLLGARIRRANASRSVERHRRATRDAGAMLRRITVPSTTRSSWSTRGAPRAPHRRDGSRRLSRSRRPSRSLANDADAADESRFDPLASKDLIERFVEPCDVDEEVVAVCARETKTRKCARRKTGYSNVVLLQAFDWQSWRRRARDGASFYARTETRAGAIEDLGFTHVWLPPPSAAVDRQGYMPTRWYDLTSNYGDERELMTLIEALNHRGVDAICDVVVNHKCAEYSTDGRFVSFADETSPSGRRLDWGEFAIVGDHPVFPGKGGDDSGDTIDIAPDLDHSNEEIREAIVEWLNWLKEDIGFSGYRFDYVRGYAREYAREYVLRTVGAETFCVAENWVGMRWSDDYLLYNQDKPRRALVDWLDGSGDCAALFDFPTKGILQEAVKRSEYWRLADSQRSQPGLSGWAPQSAAVFIENHDTARQWAFPRDRLGLGYAYALTHPGIPVVFASHLWNDGGDDDGGSASRRVERLREEIRLLLDIRARACVCCESVLDIKIADSDLYVAFVDDAVAVKLGPRYEAPTFILDALADFELAAHGDDYAVWLRKDLL